MGALRAAEEGTEGGRATGNGREGTGESIATTSRKQGKMKGYMAGPVYKGKGRGGCWRGVIPSAIPPFPPPPYPAVVPVYPPPPTDVPPCAAAGTHAAVPAGRRGDVGGTVREGRRAQEDMGEDRGGREEATGEQVLIPLV